MRRAPGAGQPALHNRKDWQKITAASRDIYSAPTVAAAEARFETFAADFGDQYPAVIHFPTGQAAMKVLYLVVQAEAQGQREHHRPGLRFGPRPSTP